MDARLQGWWCRDLRNERLWRLRSAADYPAQKDWPALQRRAARLSRQPTMDDAVEAALRRCEPPKCVQQLRLRDCSWDDASQTIVVAAPTREQPSVLVLELCENFPRIRIEAGDAVFFVSEESQTLPSGTHVAGDVFIRGPERRTLRWRSLPEDLQIGGSLLIRNLVPDKLLEGIETGGDLALDVQPDAPGGEPVSRDVAVGERLIVGGALDLRIAGDVAFPDTTTRADFGLTFTRCKLQTLPPALRLVRGDLRMIHCPNLTSLPPDLEVQGDVHMHQCCSLRALPEGLLVAGDLIARGCEALVDLPESLRVGGAAMELDGCRALSEVPLQPLITHVDGPRPQPLRLDVRGTRVVEAQLQGLLALQPKTITLQFDAPRRAAAGEGDNGAGAAAAAAAATTAPRDTREYARVEREFGVLQADLEPHIDPAYRRSVLQFLSKLLDSAEFHDVYLRDGLRRRVKEALQLIIDDPSARPEVILRIVDSLGACSDQPLWALGQIQLVAATVRARGDRAALRELGRGVMRLGIVHDHAGRSRTRANGPGNVHVVLDFEIALREELQLPVSSVTQSVPARTARRQMVAARREALAVTEEEFEAWLQGWPEWQRQLRLEAVRPYAKLRKVSEDVDAALLQDAADLAGDPVQDPVFALPDTGNVWSYADLCAHWVRGGTDFSNIVVSHEAFVGEVVRRLSDDVQSAARVTLRESLRRRLSILWRSRPRSDSADAA